MTVVYHDLYAEKFDPILPHEEIPKDAELDPVVAQHCREVGGGRRLSRRASELVGDAAGDPQGLARPRLAAGRGLSVRPRRRRAAA